MTWNSSWYSRTDQRRNKVINIRSSRFKWRKELISCHQTSLRQRPWRQQLSARPRDRSGQHCCWSFPGWHWTCSLLPRGAHQAFPCSRSRTRGCACLQRGLWRSRIGRLVWYVTLSSVGVGGVDIVQDGCLNGRRQGGHRLTASSTLAPASLPTFVPNFSALFVPGSFSRAFSASTGVGEESQLEVLRQFVGLGKFIRQSTYFSFGALLLKDCRRQSTGSNRLHPPQRDPDTMEPGSSTWCVVLATGGKRCRGCDWSKCWSW